MSLAKMTHITTKHLFAFRDGFHNLALTQWKKYQLPLERSGFRPFRKWSCGKTNLIQTGHHGAVWSLSFPAVVSYGIGYREKQYWQSNTRQKELQNRGYCQTKSGGNDVSNPFEKELDNNINKTLRGSDVSNPFEKELDNNINKTLRGSDVSNPSKVVGKRPRGSGSSDAPNPKRPNLGGIDDISISFGPVEGVTNLDETKSANALANVISSDLGVHVDLEKKRDGEFVLNIKMDTQSSTAEDKVGRAEEMAQKAAVLLLYGEMLVDMGNKLRAQSLASLCSAFQSPGPSNSEYADVE